MFARTVRMSAVAALAAGALVGLAGPAAGAPGPGTFTTITTPSQDLLFTFDPNVTNQFPVSGSTSFDVTSVDIDCIRSGDVQVFAAGVPVTGGAFGTTAVYPGSITLNCRLRAIPSGVDPTSDYLGSYAGPVLYTNGLIPQNDQNSSGTVPVTFTAFGEQGEGVGTAESASASGVTFDATIETPGMELRGSGALTSAFALPSSNITAGGTPDASAIRVDGHNAWLPYHVDNFLNASPQSLGLTQSALATTFQAKSNGDVTVTESAPLKRCDGDNTYPPDGGSCSSLINTGVTFKRVMDMFRGAHQVRVRDSFTSTDSMAHTVSAQYHASAQGPPTGSTGYTFPGHGSTFTASAPDQVVTGLGTKAGTIFILSDIYAVSGDPLADTLGLTWSRAPSKVQFSHTDKNLFAMPYSLSVPAGRAAYLGFAYSEHVDTADTRKLAAVAVHEMVNVPAIGSPHNRAVIKGHTTTVKGSVTLGANGLPTSVTVNGHTAHLTRVSATKETYSVSFREPFGKHTIKVTAKDSAGNAASRSIRVKNVAP